MAVVRLPLLLRSSPVRRSWNGGPEWLSVLGWGDTVSVPRRCPTIPPATGGLITVVLAWREGCLRCVPCNPNCQFVR